MSFCYFRAEESIINLTGLKQFTFYSLELSFDDVYLREVVNVGVQGVQATP
jgi:hypothetical protein